MKKFHKMKPSLSAFVVFLATDLDLKQLGAAHEMFYYENWDHDEKCRNSVSGDVTASWLGVNTPTLTDPSIAPPGKHLMTLTTLVPYDIGASWREEKSRYAEGLLQS